MSTPETDQYWLAQEAIYQNFCSLVDGTKYVVGKDALNKMSTIDGVDPKTYARCKEYLESTMVQPNDEWADVPMSEEDDPNVQYQQYVLDRERDAEDERDMRNAPSEGPFTYDNLSST